MAYFLQRIADGDWQTLRRVVDAIAQRLNPPLPQARVYNDTSANNTLTTAVEATVVFNKERWDNGDLHSTSANTGRLTAPITGLYAFGASIAIASNATGRRYVGFRVNGTTSLGFVELAAVNGDDTYFMPSSSYRLAAGDYVEVRAFQDSGGNLNVNAGGNFSPEFWMYRVGGYTNEGV